MNPRAASGRIVRILACMAVVMICILCGCDKYGIRYYKLGNINLYNDNDTGQYSLDAPTDTIPAKAYAIRVALIATVNAPSSKYNSDDPYENTCAPSNPPANVNIYSLTGFDVAHPALSSLNDLFFGEVAGGYASPIVPAQLVPSVNFGYINLSTGDTLTERFLLILMAAPATLGERAFVVNIVYCDSSRTADTITAYLY